MKSELLGSGGFLNTYCQDYQWGTLHKDNKENFHFSSNGNKNDFSFVEAIDLIVEELKETLNKNEIKKSNENAIKIFDYEKSFYQKINNKGWVQACPSSYKNNDILTKIILTKESEFEEIDTAFCIQNEVKTICENNGLSFSCLSKVLKIWVEGKIKHQYVIIQLRKITVDDFYNSIFSKKESPKSLSSLIGKVKVLSQINKNESNKDDKKEEN